MIAVCNLITYSVDLDLVEYDDCTHGSLRLVNSTHDTGVSSGRLELCLNQAWGTVCGEQLGYDEATVACRQLGGFNDLGKLVLSMYQYYIRELVDSIIYIYIMIDVL